MIHSQLQKDSDGRFPLPCCGVRLKAPFDYPVHCQCEARFNGLATAIDSCSQRGNETGEVVSCGCPSSPQQPVFECRIHGTAVRHATTNFKGQACIACEFIRSQFTEINDG